MSQALANITRAENTAVNKQAEITTASLTSYIDDLTDPEEPELTDEDSLDEPLEAEEESEDDSSGDDYGVAESFSIRPLWILYEGQILWAASHYGFNLTKKEYLRRRIQTLLDFLAKKFPRKSYGELLLSLQGFFAKDNESSKGNWLDSLKNSGILYFDESTKKYQLMPLGKLRAGKGQGKLLPGKIESLWLEHEFSKLTLSLSPKDFDKHKAPLIDSFKNFCAELNALCSIFDSEDDDSEEEKSRGIGLKKTEFIYEESTLDRKKFLQWKKLWGER